jgi:hypothetical protein
MQTTLTEQDVIDAHFAHAIRQLAATERDTPERIIRGLETYEGQAAEQIAQYRRGLVLLKDYIVLVSERSIIGGRFDAKTLARVVSPIIRVSSGYIATSEATRSVALAQR